MHRRWTIYAGVALALLVLLGAGGLWRMLQTPLHLPDGPVLIKVPAGASAQSIARELHSEGVLSHPRVWSLYARFSGLAGQIQQGQYRLGPGLTSAGLLGLLVSGRTVQYPFTLVDGWTFRQIIQAMKQDPHIKLSLKPTQYAGLIHQLGGPRGMSPQGWFYPNTYFFSQGADGIGILRRAYDAMRRYLKQQWAARAPNLPLKTPYQALILASIVEKETGLPRERSLVAGVFINRLRKGMRLQSDPTVIFGLGAAYHGALTFKDLRSNTAYNTYVHTGLPPTPISVPNPAAIHAVLHPAHTNYMYFVAKGNGVHVFSRTYAQQRREVARYQLGQGKASRGG